MNDKKTIVANKYSVATYDICKKIDWKGETFFYWNSKGGLSTKDEIDFFECQLTLKKCIPAPQFQDVMNLLPQNIDYDTTYSLVVSKLSVHYENSLGHTKHNFMVVNNNIVDALCQLYLSLKSENVIL